MRKICRVIFSRYFFSALVILAELFLLFYILFFAYEYSALALLVRGVVDVVVVISLVNRDSNPEYKVSWLAVLMLISPFGVVLYLMFYSRRVSSKKTALMREIQNSLNGFSDKEGELASECDTELAALREADSLAAGKAFSILGDDRLAEVYRGSVSKYFSLGEEMFESMISDIATAKKYIFLEYFIIEEGQMWEKIHTLLKEKVSHGVEVRLIYDDIGCMKTLPAKYDKILSAEGILTRRFSPVTPRISTAHNNRNHRKILIVDGRVAYTGGVNIADEYINQKERFGHWKDGGVRVLGTAVRGFLKLFLSSWDFSVGRVGDNRKYLSDTECAEGADGGFYIPFGSGPAPIYSRQAGKDAISNVINQASRYVYITTPYLIIDYDLTEALIGAARRGVDVRIITPGVADKRIVKLMTKSAYPTLISAGVRIYEYSFGFIHEKTVVSDDAYALVGTINMDYRSLVHHYEDAVWMYGTQTVCEIKDAFLDTAGVSSPIGAAEARLNFFEWIVRNLLRVFAPLL
jgi:cardiolipin synthase